MRVTIYIPDELAKKIDEERRKREEDSYDIFNNTGGFDFLFCTRKNLKRKSLNSMNVIYMI
jgi:hypothetical protein